jgi:biotin synthase
MLDVVGLKNKVVNNYIVTREDALELVNVDLNELTKQANEIRKHFCGNRFDACTIINVKSGKCSENCIFCAQSMHHDTDIDIYPLIDTDELKQKTRRLGMESSLLMKKRTYCSLETRQKRKSHACHTHFLIDAIQ